MIYSRHWTLLGRYAASLYRKVWLQTCDTHHGPEATTEETGFYQKLVNHRACFQSLLLDS